MHAINLGVLYDVNGACMKLGIRISNKFAGACRCNVNWSQLFMFLRLLRIALCESSYWGPGVDLQSHLDLAYDAFKAFTRAEKINCSQPPFKVRSVAKSFRLRRYVLLICCSFFPRAFIYTEYWSIFHCSVFPSQGCQKGRPGHVHLQGLQWKGGLGVSVPMYQRFGFEAWWWRSIGYACLLRVSRFISGFTCKVQILLCVA